MSTERRPRIRSILIGGAAALSVATALTGCAAAGSPGGRTTVTDSLPAPTTTVTSTATATATATATSTSTSTRTPSTSSSSFRVADCDTAKLKGSLKADGGAAGSTYYDLVLTNTGAQSCTLQGWPGTSFSDANGRLVGAPADFDRSTTHETVTLTPNGTAVAQLQVAEAGNFTASKCDAFTIHHIKVYPPGSKASLLFTTPNAIQACDDPASHQLRVGALHAG